MIELKNFEGYFLDLKTFKVFSSYNQKFLKPIYEGKKTIFTLYKNGVAEKVELFSILKDNIKSINILCKQKKN